MRQSWVSVPVLVACLTGPSPARSPVRPFETSADAVAKGKIDELVFSRLKRLEISPAPLCSDEVFVRRAYLDVIGTLPTAQEARIFLADKTPGKRGALIDRLLTRKEFADYWAMKWCDVLRVKSEFPINLWPNAVMGYHRWIRAWVKDDVPYDRFVREMLTASGSNFRRPQVNFYRAMQNREPTVVAQAVALTFMGVRAESWPKERWAEMAAFFSQIGYKATDEWKEEIVLFDPVRPRAAPAGRGADEVVLPDGKSARLRPDQDPREAFADWLIAPSNPYFARNIVNRVWSWLLGRGIIHEPDDIRPGNPPSNPELLALLERELVSTHYDLKHIYRLILNSKTYQLSSIPGVRQAEGDRCFSRYPIRRLDAEVLIDAICQVTGTTEKYSSPIPEPFTFIPEGQRSIELADASITSTFLEMFGRSARDTGLETERNNRSTAAQRLHLLNSSHVLRKIEESPKLRALGQPGGGRARGRPRDAVDELYLTILSRFPTDEELRTIGEYAREGDGRRRVGVDLAWALINSAEFLYRH